MMCFDNIFATSIKSQDRSDSDRWFWFFVCRDWYKEYVFRGQGHTESFWGRLKVGRLYGRKFETRRQAMDEVIDWMTFYNHRRIHSTLGYVSPMQFGKSGHAAQLLKAA